MNPFIVKLHAYDLSRGFAKLLFANTNPPIDAIWHSCIEINGYEYYFQNKIAKTKTYESYGMPHRIEVIGTTELTEEMIDQIFYTFNDNFNERTYNIFSNNCNHFADHFCKAVCGVGIPKDILHLPETVKKNDFFKNIFKN